VTVPVQELGQLGSLVRSANPILVPKAFAQRVYEATQRQRRFGDSQPNIMVYTLPLSRPRSTSLPLPNHPDIIELRRQDAPFPQPLSIPTFAQLELSRSTREYVVNEAQHEADTSSANIGYIPVSEASTSMVQPSQTVCTESIAR
jgi:hypothetical protein